MFETIALLGGFWFFCFVLLVFVAGIISAELDSMFGSITTMVMLLAGGQFLFDIPIWQTIVDKPISILFIIASYIIIGVIYVVAYRFNRWLKGRSVSIKSDFKRFEKDYMTEHNGEYPSGEEFRKSSYYEKYTPSANADLITSWVMLWPWAVFWDLCNRPIRYAFSNVRVMVGKMLDNVGAKATDKIIRDDNVDTY
jgi:hypothetical protein